VICFIGSPQSVHSYMNNFFDIFLRPFNSRNNFVDKFKTKWSSPKIDFFHIASLWLQI